MSTTDLINLGLLFVAAMGFAAGAVYTVYRWIRVRRFSVRFAVSPGHNQRLYIAGVRIRRDLPPTVSRLAAWCRFTFVNVGPETRLITELAAQENGEPDRPLIGPLVGEVVFDFETDVPAGVVPLPLAIEPQHGIHAWGLVSIAVPEKLGEILFNLYGSAASAMPSFQRWSGRFPEAEACLAERVEELHLPVKVVSLALSEVEMTFPILEKRGNELAFVARLGSLPPQVHHRVIQAAREKDWNVEDVLRVKAHCYQFRARLATGGILSRSLRIDHDAMWWSRSFRDGSADTEA